MASFQPPSCTGFTQRPLSVASPSFSWKQLSREQYQSLTTERVRIPFESIVDSNTTSIEDFLKRGRFRTTRHHTQRCNDYLGKASKRQDYIELLPEEEDSIRKIPSFLQTRFQSDQFKIVEFGLNQFEDVCKISVVVKAPNDRKKYEMNDIHKTKERVLFVCIGADEGIKTWYITPGYKARPQGYKSRDGVPTRFKDKAERGRPRGGSGHRIVPSEQNPNRTREWSAPSAAAGVHVVRPRPSSSTQWRTSQGS